MTKKAIAHFVKIKYANSYVQRLSKKQLQFLKIVNVQ